MAQPITHYNIKISLNSKTLVFRKNDRENQDTGGNQDTNNQEVKNQYAGLDSIVHHPQGNRLMPKTWMKVEMTILKLLLKQIQQREPSETWNLVECLEKKTGTYIALPVFNRMEDSSIEYN